MAGAGGKVKNTAARRVRRPSWISHRPLSEAMGWGVEFVSMPVFLPRATCPTQSDGVGAVRKGGA